MEEENAKLTGNSLLARERRYFSEAVKKLIVEEIDAGLSKVGAERKYNISHASIFKWYAKYSKHYMSTFKTVMEHEIDSIKLKKIESELEMVYGMLGRSKAENLLLQAIIEKADESMGTDLKKNFGTPPLPNFSAKKTTLK